MTDMDGRAMENAKEYTQRIKNTNTDEIEQSENLRRSKRQEEQKEVSKWKPLPSKRKFPLWLRSIIFFLLVAISLCAGLMVGYSVIGNGESATNIFHRDVWEHILSFFK